MRRKNLYSLIRYALVAGFVTGPAVAQANENLYQRYWQSVSGYFTQPTNNLRYRPANTLQTPNVSRFVRPGFDRPAVTAHNSHFRYRPLSQPVVRPAAYPVPAFQRQYAWQPANVTVYRRGGSKSHYASESNTDFEQSYAQGYQSQPVTSQGYRYRNGQRNAPFVSFSDRVRGASSVTEMQVREYSLPQTRQSTAMPMEEMNKPVVRQAAAQVFQLTAKPINQHHQPAAAATFKPVMPAAPVSLYSQPEVAVEEPPVKVFMSSQPLPSADGFNFRPDERFQPAGRPAVRAPQAPQLRPAKPAQEPVVVDNLQLARASATDNSNPWNNYSFRPMDSAIQR